jgi:hypothetical protein
VPDNNKTGAVRAGRISYEELSFVNLSPRELMELELHTVLSGDAVSILKGGKVVFTYRTLNNRKKKVVIGKID